jgi:hypothetical protein
VELEAAALSVGILEGKVVLIQAGGDGLHGFHMEREVARRLAAAIFETVRELG